MLIKAKTWKLGLLCAAATLSAPALAATSCEGLAKLQIGSTTITSAGSVTGPLAVESPGGQGVANVPFCRVQGVTRPTPKADVRFEVWLPRDWNSRMKTPTTGGYLGGIPYTRMVEDVANGYVMVGSNLGHEGGSDPKWTLDPDALAAYGYGAHPFVNRAARALVQAFYDKGPSKSYFEGCSGGGRQALMMAQRYPDLFDGIIAGAPSNSYPDSIMQILWQHRIHKPQSNDGAPLIPQTKLAMVSASVMARCDAKDGLKDGELTDPRACDTDLSMLRCKAGEAADCLTDKQIAGLRDIYGGPRKSNGVPLYRGSMPGGEYSWNLNVGDTTRYGAFFGDVVLENTSWDWRTLDFDNQYEFMRDRLNPVMATPSPDLTAFKARGGKLIQFHGWHDQLIAPTASPNYYASVIAFERLKGDKNADAAIDKLTPKDVVADLAKPQGVESFYRLFMVPGMAHCRGGNATNRFDQGANGVGSKRDLDHSLQLQLERWVEQGVAPERVVATQFVGDDPTKGIVRERPLCAYPKMAHYKGSGDVNDPANFVCGSTDTANLTPNPADMAQIKYSLKVRNVIGPRVEVK